MHFSSGRRRRSSGVPVKKKPSKSFIPEVKMRVECSNTSDASTASNERSLTQPSIPNDWKYRNPNKQIKLMNCTWVEKNTVKKYHRSIWNGLSEFSLFCSSQYNSHKTTRTRKNKVPPSTFTEDIDELFGDMM